MSYAKTLTVGNTTYDIFNPDDLPETYPPSEHNHDDRYYTEDESDSLLASKSPAIESAASGAIVTIEDGAAAPVVDLTVAIEPVQSGSGDPSPDNVRPISGWTGCNVYRTGKNLYNPQYKSTDLDNKYFTFFGVTSGTSSQKYKGIFLKAGVTYTFTVDIGSVNKFGIYASWKNSNSVITIVGNSGTRQTHTWQVTPDFSDNYVIWLYSSTNWDEMVESADDITLMISAGNATVDYVTPNPTTLSIDLQSEAGTVYGGTLDVTTGVLTVDRYGVDLGTLSWAEHPSIANAFQVALSPASVNGYLLRSICSKYKLYNSSTVGQQTYGIAISNPGTRIYIKDIDYSDVTTLTQSLDGETLVYTLAIPLTYQLTPQQMTTLLGENNIWADTGDVSVTYRADTKRYIDGAIEAVTPDTVEVTGTTPGITAVAGTRYICGECATLGITLPESGIVDVIFSSGSTPTVLTVTPPSGVTLKWANGFDPTDLDADTVYEINIMDGLGVAVSWT